MFNKSTQIKATEDYNQFKRIKGNRKVAKAHVNKLRSAIEADPQVIEYNPILVNDKWEVIDGQHRLEAIKQLELPVYYQQVKGLSLHNVQALNSNSRTWGPMDYAQAFHELGNKNYTAYLEHRLNYRLNHEITMGYVGFDDSCTTTSFRLGKFVASDPVLTERYTEQLLDMRDLIPHWNLRATAIALLKVMQHPEYDHKRMVNKMKKFGQSLERQSVIPEAIRSIETIYNHGLGLDRAVRFY